MSDLIDRQELIYSLECLPFYHQFWKPEGCEGLWESEAVENCIKNMPSAQQWTPVSEGLPKITEHHVSEVVICYTANGAYCFGSLEENPFGQTRWSCERDDEYHLPVGKVIAWMPLPEPYMAESEDKE